LLTGTKKKPSIIKKFLLLINMAKKRNPAFAYKIMSTFYIKIDLNKHYCVHFGKWAQRPLQRDLTMNDFPEGTILPSV
jgi:hypothetical protein